jgi:acyl-CoA reductase-like NAD-dependent aldehyde dehydrogenase
MATMSSVNPATGEVLARIEEISDAELDARIARAAQTFSGYGRELARDGIREFVNVKTVVVQELARPAAAGQSATE